MVQSRYFWTDINRYEIVMAVKKDYNKSFTVNKGLSAPQILKPKKYLLSNSQENVDNLHTLRSILKYGNLRSPYFKISFLYSEKPHMTIKLLNVH